MFCLRPPRRYTAGEIRWCRADEGKSEAEGGDSESRGSTKRKRHSGLYVLGLEELPLGERLERLANGAGRPRRMRARTASTTMVEASTGTQDREDAVQVSVYSFPTTVRIRRW